MARPSPGQPRGLSFCHWLLGGRVSAFSVVFRDTRCHDSAASFCHGLRRETWRNCPNFLLIRSGRRFRHRVDREGAIRPKSCSKPRRCAVGSQNGRLGGAVGAQSRRAGSKSEKIGARHGVLGHGRLGCEISAMSKPLLERKIVFKWKRRVGTPRRSHRKPIWSGCSTCGPWNGNTKCAPVLWDLERSRSIAPWASSGTVGCVVFPTQPASERAALQ